MKCFVLPVVLVQESYSFDMLEEKYMFGCDIRLRLVESVSSVL